MEAFADRRPLGRQETKVLAHLQDGRPHSVVEMSVALRISDPRSAIRYLRRQQYPIFSEWRRTRYARYKVYGLKSPVLPARKEAGNEQ